MADLQREPKARARDQQSAPVTPLSAQTSESERRGAASPGTLAILIDGACEMCRDSGEAIRRVDKQGAIEIFDLQDPAHRARFPQFTLDQLLEALHAVDDRGNVYRGARAINEIMRRQRGLRRWLAYLWYLPGYPQLAEWQYRRLAATRYDRDAHGRLKSQARPASGR